LKRSGRAQVRSLPHWQDSTRRRRHKPRRSAAPGGQRLLSLRPHCALRHPTCVGDLRRKPGVSHRGKTGFRELSGRVGRTRMSWSAGGWPVRDDQDEDATLLEVRHGVDSLRAPREERDLPPVPIGPAGLPQLRQLRSPCGPAMPGSPCRPGFRLDDRDVLRIL
jgi:hypothetical protein